MREKKEVETQTELSDWKGNKTTLADKEHSWMMEKWK
jgi:hypothetical protein